MYKWVVYVKPNRNNRVVSAPHLSINPDSTESGPPTSDISDTMPNRSSSMERRVYLRRTRFSKTGGASAGVCHSCASLRGIGATGVTSRCQCRSEPLLRPNLSLGQKSIFKKFVAVVLKKVLKKDPQASYDKPVNEIYTLDKCKLFIRELATQLERILQYNSRVILCSVKEGRYSEKECQQFVLEWAAELSTLDDKYLGQAAAVEGSYTDRPGDGNSEKQREDTDLRSQMRDQKLQKAQNILRKWTKSKDSVHLPEDMCSALQDLDKQWKRGKLSNALPVMDFIMWAVSQNQHEKGSAPERWLRTRQRIRTSASVKYIPDFAWNWIVEAQTEVRLDQKTASPDLILSEDRKSVKMDTLIESKDKRRDGFHKVRHQYDGWWCVLGTEGFTKGRHYWEVDVKGKRDWRIGVVKESAPRKGFVSLNTQSGYWTLRLQLGELIALTVPVTKFPEVVIPSKVGVYLDVEEGQLSFYDVERRSHIYTFNDTFTEKVYPIFGTIETDRYLVIL